MWWLLKEPFFKGVFGDVTWKTIQVQMLKVIEVVVEPDVFLGICIIEDYMQENEETLVICLTSVPVIAPFEKQCQYACNPNLTVFNFISHCSNTIARASSPLSSLQTYPFNLLGTITINQD